MKLKEINRTAIQSWSPAQQHPVYLAAGTSAQQLDATFSTNASLEIFELDLAEPSLDMKSCGTYSSSHRYHKLVWGPHGMEGSLPSGVLIAGGENGDVILYDPAKIVAGDSDVIITQSDKHTGPVRALDVNSFQTNLVASGGNESEIYIWDLNNFGSPMTPGPKTQPLEDISCVAWNRQVQHILASASPSGRASVWDLRKNDLIIKVSDHSNRMHCSGLAWNPEVATQLVLASEDDRMPVIQMWDLRFATSPFKILENHTRGVLAIAWSLADPELLLSCGKDNRILCWNPNTAEVLYELPTSTQWCFDIQWCPRNPAVLSAAAFDGHIGIYSIMGGSSQAHTQMQADQITSSFGNMDPFGTGQTLPPLQMPRTPAAPATITPLKKPPKWIRRPVGASFAFGGKLVSLENLKLNPQQPQQTTAHLVHVSQVVTETAFLKRSGQLQMTLNSGNFVDFCEAKIAAAQNEFERTVWSFLKVNFEDDARGKYLELLGYKKEELALKIAAALEEKPVQPEKEVTAPVEAESSPPEETVEEITGPGSVEAGINLRVSQDVDGLITQALLTGDFEGAVELCLHDNRMADSIILAIAGGAELLEKTQKKYFTKTHSKITKLISAVVTKDWHDVLQTCDLQNWKEALAAVMTYAQPDEFSSLCGMMGSRLEAAEDDQLQAQACLCYICAGNLEKLVSCWTRAQEGQCPLSLQDLVEKVVVLRQAVEKSQGSGSSVVGALLAEKMSQYSSLLASQGSLDTALAYLPEKTNQAAVQQLRDRLSRALGQQATAPPAPAPAQPPAPQQTEAHPRQTYNPGQPQVPQPAPAPAPAPVPSAGPAQSQYYQPARSATTVTSWSNQTPTGFPSAPPPPQLAHASDQKVEAGQPRFGMQAPGAAAPPQASAAPPAYMYSQQYQPYHQVNQFQPGAGAPAIYQPLQYSAASLPPLPASSCCPPAPAPGFRAQYMQPGPPPPGPPPPRYPGPPAGHPSSPHPLSPTASSAFSPLSSSGASFQHGGPGSPSSYMPPPPPTGASGGFNPDTDCFMEGPQNGWNDPPALSRVPKKKKVPENYTPPAPITAPIMSPLGGDPQAQQVPTMPPQPGVHGQPGVQPPYPGMQQQQPLPHQPMNPALPKTSVEGAPGAPIGDVIQPLQSIPAEKITKKPIPDEHLVLKSTFEGLIQKCLAAANDPQTKRKLDDANKRLEALYDKLREQTLSPAIVGGLHNMVRSIEARSYTEGLTIHTHIVSTNNFSETSAFMPVLKVVLTQANRLGV
ncbi:protein transport protein Sec31A isoform X5 [Osmerus eperlanus]|uniref:protein transport protein Sec31A isoform X5 n=1 Tax=Osmerus eperlanus TaxID=29151 RepID=UPI002E100EBA